MINLLPENEKMLIRKEYRLRVLVVGLCFCLTLILASILLLTPSFVTALYKKQSTQQKIAASDQTETVEHKELVSQLQTLKLTSAVLAPAEGETMPTTFLQVLIKDKTVDNVIHNIQFTNNSDGKFSATISGIARSRQSLITFTSALEKESIIEKLDLPVGSLALESNIPFNIAIAGKH